MRQSILKAGFLVLCMLFAALDAHAAPVAVTINQKAGQADPSPLNTVLFTAVFASPVDPATFTTADISTVGSTATGITVNSVTEVTPNDGTTFEISVTATGPGTITASIPAATYTLGSAVTLGTTGGAPNGITIDADGNVYTANASDDTVTKITPAGTSSTFATTGESPSTIVIDSSGNLYTADGSTNTVTKITPLGVSSTFAATGSAPADLTIDTNGTIYTVNNGSQDVTKITSDGSASTLGTTGGAPQGIVLDPDGNVYVTNCFGNNVTRITPGGVSTTFASVGICPAKITIDAEGNLYVANQVDNTVSKVAPDGTSAILGTTGNAPIGIAVDPEGNVYTSNVLSNDISIITPVGMTTTVPVTGSFPRAILRDSEGNVYTANSQSNNVTKFPASVVTGVEALNGKGNAAATSTDNSVTFTPDTVAPDVTVDQAGSQMDPTTSNPIIFTIVFSEAIDPVTFTADDLTLGGTAAASAGAPTSSDDTTWTVPVTASSAGTVTVSIAAGKVTDPSGNPNNASTSTDNSVTFQIVPTPSAPNPTPGAPVVSGVIGTSRLPAPSIQIRSLAGGAFEAQACFKIRRVGVFANFYGKVLKEESLVVRKRLRLKRKRTCIVFPLSSSGTYSVFYEQKTRTRAGKAKTIIGKMRQIVNP